MHCIHCGSERVLAISAKCNDMCSLQYKGSERHDYVPRDLNIGGGDYVIIDLCLECGKVQGEFPIEDPEFYQPSTARTKVGDQAIRV